MGSRIDETLYSAVETFGQIIVACNGSYTTSQRQGQNEIPAFVLKMGKGNKDFEKK